ncbi:uncharacterized protein LOC135682474 [Rhopilema esculentum]|uniref:uncharacterized protein LOC135682474 n=1 Tax=Rhopilema esculentum TaxID=499914 RepID=UPI0031D1BDE5
MPLLGIVSQSMVYYTHYFLLKRTCKASAKRFRNDGAIYFYKACIAFALGALLVPVVTILGSNYVSVGELNHEMVNGTSCGPFKDKTPLAILNEISSSKERLPNWVFLTLNWFTSAAVFPSILVLSIIVYVQTVRVAKHKKKFKELQIDHNKFKMKSNARLLRAGEAV